MKTRRSALAYLICWSLATLMLFLTVCFAQRARAQQPSTGSLGRSEQLPSIESLDSLLNIRINTVTKTVQSQGDAPASVSILTAQDIERYGWQTLAELLNSVRGFYLGYDRNYTYVGVRGFGRPADYNDRILLLINGQTLNEDVYGSAFLGSELGLHLSNLERVEIVRGPGSSLYGTGAMLAVINLITKNNPGSDPDHTCTQLEGQIGSFGNRQGSFMLADKVLGGVGLSVNGVYSDVAGQDLYFKEFDNDSTNHGIAKGLDWERYYGLNAVVSYGELHVQGGFSHRTKGIPTASFGIAFNEPRAQTMDELGYAEVKLSHPLSNSMGIMARAFLNSYGYAGIYPQIDHVGTDASTGRFVGGEAQLNWDVSPIERIIIGSEYKNNLISDYEERVDGAVVSSFNLPFSEYSLYAENELQLVKELSLTVGARFDIHSSRTGELSPRAALVYHPADPTTLKFIYGTAFRDPNRYELYYSDPISNARPNPGLDDEDISTFELDWEQRLAENWFATVSVFHYGMKSLIDQVQLPDGSTQFQNISNAITNGAEFEIQARWQNGVSSYLSYAYSDARDPDMQIGLTNSPKSQLNFGVSAPLAKVLSASLEVISESSRITVMGPVLDGYTIVNANITTRTLFDHFTLALRLRNLLDTHYSLPAGREHIEIGIPQDGRNLLFTLRYML